MALGSGDDSLEIHTMRGSSFNSFLDPTVTSGHFSRNVIAGSEMVSITRLDTIFDSIMCGVNDPRIYSGLPKT